MNAARAPATPAERLAPYRCDVARACAEAGEDPFRLAGLILRESEAGWAPGYDPKGTPAGWGDADIHGVRHGFGLCQLDSRWHGAWIGTPESLTPFGQFRRACTTLRGDRAWFKRAPVPLSGDDLERAVYAAYNAGAGHVLHGILAHHNPDAPTAHGTYSADVFKRAEALRALHPDFFKETTP